MLGLAYQEIYHRPLWKMSIGQGLLFVLLAIAGLALIGFAVTYHSGQISHRLLMIAIGVLANCMGPLLWWSGVQTNREIQGLPEQFKEASASGGEWKRVSESRNSPRWFEVTVDGAVDDPIIFYDRWQAGPFEDFEQHLQEGDVPVKLWYVQRDSSAAPVLVRVAADL